MSGIGGAGITGARDLVTRVFGVLAAAAAAEHGVGEALQGGRAPAGPFIESWPDSAFFRIEAGEPALTLVPNLLGSGVVTLLLSALLGWRVLVRSARRPRLDLFGLSILLLLAGGGFGPPVLGLAVATAASLPEPRRRHRSGLPARAFWWIFAATVLVWLTLVPGLPLLDLALGTGDVALLPVIILAFTLFPVCVAAARAADAAGISSVSTSAQLSKETR